MCCFAYLYGHYFHRSSIVSSITLSGENARIFTFESISPNLVSSYKTFCNCILFHSNLFVAQKLESLSSLPAPSDSSNMGSNLWPMKVTKRISIKAWTIVTNYWRRKGYQIQSSPIHSCSCLPAPKKIKQKGEKRKKKTMTIPQQMITTRQQGNNNKNVSNSSSNKRSPTC